jgi:hypothetical protein
MKKIFSIFLLLICFSASTTYAQLQEDLDTYNKERLSIQKKGMGALGIWAIGNIAWGTVGVLNSEGAAKEFNEMNLIWNGVNLALAIPGYISAGKGKYALTLRQTYKEQQKVEKSFLINSGLDLGYILGGLYLTEKSKSTSNKTNHDKELGYGNSFMLQGAFLLLLDVTLYSVHSTHGNKKLNSILDKVNISSKGVGYIHRF